MGHRISQIFPRNHWTIYGDMDGRNHFVIWKQWFGRCYSVIDFPFEEPGH